jgi:hypothetical protein
MSENGFWEPARTYHFSDTNSPATKASFENSKYTNSITVCFYSDILTKFKYYLHLLKKNIINGKKYMNILLEQLT